MSKSVLKSAITLKQIDTETVSIPEGSYVTNVRLAANGMFEITWNGIPVWVAPQYLKFVD